MSIERNRIGTAWDWSARPNGSGLGPGEPGHVCEGLPCEDTSDSSADAVDAWNRAHYPEDESDWSGPDSDR